MEPGSPDGTEHSADDFGSHAGICLGDGSSGGEEELSMGKKIDIKSPGHRKTSVRDFFYHIELLQIKIPVRLIHKRRFAACTPH